MAQSARSIVVNLGTNLHAAFDAELGRVHTIWKGEPLNLWGPPYSNTKSPFICDFDGERIYTFPKLSPWFSNETQLSINFRGIQTQGNIIKFEYDVATKDGPVPLIESLTGVNDGENWTVKRRWEFPKGCSAELRYLAFAEGGVDKELFAQNKWSGTNGVAYFRSNGMVKDLAISVPTVTYSSEIITETGTEKGNPAVRFSGEEARGFVSITKQQTRFFFEISMSSIAEPLPITAQPKTALKRYAGDSQRRPDSGDGYYRIEYFPLPPEAELIITGMDWLNDRDLAVCTWLGEIYIVENATGAPSAATYRRFARGLNEPLGLTVVKEEILVVQKGELTRVSDTNGDGAADRFECVNDDWGYSGNYHSYSFGPLLTPQNDLMIFVTGQRGRADLMYQGWAIRVGKEGAQPFCSGLRVPHGWELYQGDIFVTDNQGNWIGTCRLNHLKEGKFYGFPSSKPAANKTYRAKEVEPPVLWLPRALSPSASGIETIDAAAFGPFKGQVLIGDFQNSILMRAFLEKVNGKWQGAVFPFINGFLSGVNRLSIGPDAKLYVGGGKRTWSTAAPKEFSLDRVSYTGKVPFEVREVRATKDGFELHFTKALELEPARDSENYLVKQFGYKYHEEYGSAEFDHDGKPGATETAVESVEVSEDRKVVRLKIPGLKIGFVTSFQLAVNSADDEDLRHDTFHYTLSEQPQ